MSDDSVEWPDLFTPLEFRETSARNRVMVSPMCQFCTVEYKHRITDGCG